jgi:hypothetical protein
MLFSAVSPIKCIIENQLNFFSKKEFSVNSTIFMISRSILISRLYIKKVETKKVYTKTEET